jgi:hypothetical protein
LYDDKNTHYTHFSGWMLEEEIVASLWVQLHRRHETFSTQTVLLTILAISGRKGI